MAYTRSGPKNSGRSGSYVGHHWYDDIAVIDDAARTMPPTVPHEEVAGHWFSCGCTACASYPTDVLRRLKRERLRSSGSPRR